MYAMYGLYAWGLFDQGPRGGGWWDSTEHSAPKATTIYAHLVYSKQRLTVKGSAFWFHLRLVGVS